MESRKNIWIFNHYGEPPTTGKNIRHYHFAKKLEERGYSVKIFTASTIHTTDINYIEDKSLLRKEKIQGVDFIFIRASNYSGNGKLRIKNILEYTLRLRKVAKKEGRPDIIYASSPHTLSWLVGYMISKKHGAKFIAETRDLWPETFVAMGKIKRNSIPAKVLYGLEKFIYKKADRLIFTFPGGKDYVESIGLSNSKVRYINNGIDLEEFNYNAENYIYTDSDLENINSYKVLFTGAIGLGNAIHNVVEAAKIINEKGYKDIKIILFGDGNERAKLEEHVAENMMTNIIFKDRIEKKYIPYVLSKSNLNLLSINHAPELLKYGLSANKLFDYLASGRPILSNAVCGYDLLKEYKTGITISGDSPEALAEGIVKFYMMPKETSDIYCQNALLAAKDFDFKTLTDKLEGIILELA